MKMIKNKNLWIMLFISTFLLIVTLLHNVQDGYNPAEQFMSELALGKFGLFMMFAFFSLSLSLFFGQLSLRHYPKSSVIRILMMVASISITGAGIFKLGAHTKLHVFLVATTFFNIVLVMYLLPRLVEEFKGAQTCFISWGLAFVTSCSIALGQSVIPVGIAQRIAAGCILLWLLLLAIFNLRKTV